MICSSMNPAVRRYTRRMMTAMAFYMVFLVVAVWSFNHRHPVGPLAYGLALLPAVPVVGILLVVGLYLAEEKDEFLRNMFIQAMVWGIGAVLAVSTVWGFLELFVPVPHLQLYLIFPMFWVVVGVAAALLQRRYR
jgi:hypothetical protein